MKTLIIVLVIFYSCLYMPNNLICQNHNINFDYIKVSFNKYNSENQLIYKKIFIEKYLVRMKKIDKKPIKNYDSLTIKIIPRYKVKVSESGGKTLKEIEIDTNIYPERCFAFYKDKLLGFIKFDHGMIDIILHNKKYKFYDFYECLSRKDFMIYICGINTLITINDKQIVDSFEECTNTKIYYLSGESLIEKIFNTELYDINKCESEIAGPFDFY